MVNNKSNDTESNNNLNQPTALTYEMISEMIKEHNALYKQMECESTDKPDMYIGLRAKNDHERIYMATLESEIRRKRLFLIRYPSYLQLDNHFEVISPDSGRFVEASFANHSDTSFFPSDDYPSITPQNQNDRASTGQVENFSYAYDGLDGKSSS